MTDARARDQWTDDRTTFQRVYDVLVGTTDRVTAQTIADRADCSTTGARNTLEQLVELGIAERQDGRPATYRRNDAYLRWKRIESLAREHSVATLQERLTDLVAEDEAFQETYGVPDPDAVSTADLPVDAQADVEERWTDIREWRTVRRDITILRRAIERAETDADDPVHA